MIQATVYVTLKPSVLDPEGETLKHALHSLGYPEVSEVRLGKYMQIKLQGNNLHEAQSKLEEMCAKLLANPVIEDYHIEINSI